jgi:hypothetical protein
MVEAPARKKRLKLFVETVSCQAGVLDIDQVIKKGEMRKSLDLFQEGASDTTWGGSLKRIDIKKTEVEVLRVM